MASELEKIARDHKCILGYRDPEDLSIISSHSSPLVFILSSSLQDILGVSRFLVAKNKSIYVNIDLIDGLASRDSAIKFLKEHIPCQGVMSSKAPLLRYAKTLGLETIHRLFVIDSASYRGLGKQMNLSQADLVTIIPGWPQVIGWVHGFCNRPIIASGLVCTHEAVEQCLDAGATAYCTTDKDIWRMSDAAATNP